MKQDLQRMVEALINDDEKTAEEALHRHLVEMANETLTSTSDGEEYDEDMDDDDMDDDDTDDECTCSDKDDDDMDEDMDDDDMDDDDMDDEDMDDDDTDDEDKEHVSEMMDMYPKKYQKNASGEVYHKVPHKDNSRKYSNPKGKKGMDKVKDGHPSPYSDGKKENRRTDRAK